MSEDFNCKLCDKSSKIKSKKNHLNLQYHKSSSKSIISRYSVTNPDFLNMDSILKNYVLEYNKKISFYLIICKWKTHFSNTIVSVKSDTWMSKSDDIFLRDFVLSKIRCYERHGYIFSHISEMKITFITDLRNMIYEHYLIQSKCMFEWKLNVILAKNPELLRFLENTSHPLIIKNHHDDGEIRILFQIILSK